MKLISTKKFLDYTIHGEENIQEDISGILFDIKSWDIKFLIIERGFWIFKNEYLLSVNRINKMNKENKEIIVDLSKDEFEKLPQVTKRRGRYQEIAGDYAMTVWPISGGTGAWSRAFPVSKFRTGKSNRINISKNDDVDKKISSQLRSSAEMKGYRVDAKGGEIGKVRDMIFDGTNWSIRYVIVGSDKNEIMLPPDWINTINPVREVVKLNLNREVVLNSPYVIS